MMISNLPTAEGNHHTRLNLPGTQKSKAKRQDTTLKTCSSLNEYKIILRFVIPEVIFFLYTISSFCNRFVWLESSVPYDGGYNKREKQTNMLERIYQYIHMYFQLYCVANTCSRRTAFLSPVASYKCLKKQPDSIKSVFPSSCQQCLVDLGCSFISCITLSKRRLKGTFNFTVRFVCSSGDDIARRRRSRHFCVLFLLLLLFLLIRRSSNCN